MTTRAMDLILRGAQVFDGTGVDPRRATVVVEAGRIVAVEDGDASSRKGSTVVDVTGLTLLPGLIDAHTHLGVIDLTGTTPHPVAELAAEIFTNLRLCLEAGFTTVRDLGGLDGAMAQLVSRGRVPGPTILPSGPLLCQTGGHGDYSDPYTGHSPLPAHPGLTQFSRCCDGPDEVRHAARHAFRKGATQLKLCLSGGVISYSDHLDDLQFTTAEIMAAVAEARARHTYITAHAHHPDAIRHGLDAGVTCFEHGVYLDERSAAAMAEAGAALVPTLATGELTVEHWREWGIPEAALPQAEAVRVRMYEAVRIANAAGVLLGSGSDLLGPEQNRRGLEIELKSRVLGPMHALLSATRDNARIIGDPEIGTLQPGKRADLIAVNGDPLAKPELLDDPTQVQLVVKNGAIAKDTRTGNDEGVTS